MAKGGASPALGREAGEVRFLDLPHREARALAAAGVPIWLCVNPVEYHGPHLPLHNDALLAAGLARDLHARLAGRLGPAGAPLLIAADLEIGVDPCPGPGTRRTPYRTARALVREACRALVELGARRVVLMTFHGSPMHNLALESGAELLRRAGVAAVCPFHVVLEAMLLLDDPSPYSPAVASIADPAEREAVLSGLRLDFHGGFFETSLSLHYAPGSVHPVHRELPPCPRIHPARPFALAARAARLAGRDRFARELEFAGLGLGWYALDPFPGYTGRPAHASAAAGRFFAERILERFEVAVLASLEGTAPAPSPIMPWLARLTLGGRLPGPSVPLARVASA